MIDNLMYIMQTTTVEQLKAEIDKNTFVDKNLKDFNKGKEMVDNLLELNKINNLDGYLIGGATLNPHKFLELIDKIK